MLQFFCVVCDSFKKNYKEALCSFCQKKVEEKIPLIHKRYQNGRPHYYLFRWSKESEHFCRRLIYFLKNSPEGHFGEWAKFFYHLQVDTGGEQAITPKSSKTLKNNHGASFAKALMKQNIFLSVLEVDVGNKGGKEQKQKTRKERRQRLEQRQKSFNLKENWIFVDDILVTGSTYDICAKACGKEAKALITLFYRPVTCS